MQENCQLVFFNESKTSEGSNVTFRGLSILMNSSCGGGKSRQSGVGLKRQNGEERGEKKMKRGPPTTEAPESCRKREIHHESSKEKTIAAQNSVVKILQF